MTRPVEITIDGRRITAPEGGMVLAAARGAGIEIPTLCDHPDLEPVGACRLCIVEITHPDWKGWSGLMTACLYPVTAGLEILTGSPRVREARRQVLTLLAARCPNAPAIRALAEEYGADATALHVDAASDDCILCGLCTRVCEAHSTEAITTWGRGAVKAVGTFLARPPEDCVGCGACAMVCPTGCIPATRTATSYEIWGRTFPTSVATVDEARCSGCGRCEELCPFHVVRITHTVGGGIVARIPFEHCRGCGVCLGACPAGAIAQQGLGFADLLGRMTSGGPAVLACGRANLKHDGMSLVEVPCAGRVTSPLLLSALASGADGILVLGRHQRTCRFDGAEDPAVEAMMRASAAATLVGLDADRLRFEDPPPGGCGALRSVDVFASGLSENTLRAPSGLIREEGLDTALGILAWADGEPGLVPHPEEWLALHALPAARPGGPVLFAGMIPHLDALAAPLLAPLDLPAMLRTAIRVLDRLGVTGAGVVLGVPAPGALAKREWPGKAGAVFTLSEADATALRASGIDAICMEELLRKIRPPVAPGRVACDGSPEERGIIETLGLEPVGAGTDPLPGSFVISPSERTAAEARLAHAEALGAGTLLVRDPWALARWALVTRQGAWRRSRIAPALPHQLASLALAGIAPGFRALRAEVSA